MLIAFVILARADLVSTGLSDSAVRTAAWFVAGYFLLGVAANLASRSKPERALMSPVVAVLCGLCAIVASS